MHPFDNQHARNSAWKARDLDAECDNDESPVGKLGKTASEYSPLNSSLSPLKSSDPLSANQSDGRAHNAVGGDNAFADDSRSNVGAHTSYGASSFGASSSYGASSSSYSNKAGSHGAAAGNQCCKGGRCNAGRSKSSSGQVIAWLQGKDAGKNRCRGCVGQILVATIVFLFIYLWWLVIVAICGSVGSMFSGGSVSAGPSGGDATGKVNENVNKNVNGNDKSSSSSGNLNDPSNLNDPWKNSLAAARENTKVPKTGAEVLNEFKECWNTGCGQTQGACPSFCGRDGLCCRKGWDEISGGCDGIIGHPTKPMHVCVAKSENLSQGQNLSQNTPAQTPLSESGEQKSMQSSMQNVVAPADNSDLSTSGFQAPIPVTHLNEECWNQGCGGKQGPCLWCGTEGRCCRKGWWDKSGGCDGSMGHPIKTMHVCVAPKVLK